MPARFIATLTAGLRDDSRVKMAAAGSRVPQDTLLLAAIADSLNFIAWTKTKAAQKNRGRPKSIVKAVTAEDDADNVADNVAFDSAEEFERAREMILRG